MLHLTRGPKWLGYHATRYLLIILWASLLLIANGARAQDGGLLSVEFTGNSTGTVVSNDGNINCPGDCSQSYFTNETVVLTADPDNASTTVTWSGSGTENCSGLTCSVTMEGNRPVFVDFADSSQPPIENNTLSVINDSNGLVTSTDGNISCPNTCTSSYDPETVVTLTAVENATTAFVEWQGAPNCSTGLQCQISMTSNRTVSAIFEPIEGPERSLNVIRAGTGGGSVASAGGGIDCPEDCSESYPEGTQVTLTAQAVEGSVFVGWQGAPNCDANTQCLVVMDTDKSVTAVFDAQDQPPLTLTLQTSGSGQGSVTSSDGTISCPQNCSGSYEEGTQVELTALADEGSVFTGWSGAGCSGTGSCVVDMSQNQLVTASFEASTSPEVTLQIALTGDGAGIVDSNDQGISCPEDCSQNYLQANAELVTLTATAAEGAVFNGWQGAGCTGTGSCTVTMSASRTVTAEFGTDTTNPETTLTVSNDGGGTGRIESDDGAIACPGVCSESYSEDETVTLSAIATGSSIFAGWQGAGCSGTGVCEVVMTQDRSVSALFQSDGDDDKDLVPNTVDQCPDTPLGETVDEVGCSVTQEPEDDDMDGVVNTTDQCPNTPPGEEVDTVGCGLDEEPEDDDRDGVSNPVDQCPNTPTGASVNSVGCSQGEEPEDNDNDGVTDKEDFCANTAAGDIVDSRGCAESQSDSDGDGVLDTADSCAATPSYVAAVDSEGCPTILEFGNQLGQLSGIGFNEQRLGTRLDEICPMLIKLEDTEDLTEGQDDLRKACTRLKNTDTTEDQAAFALREISLTELASLQAYAIDIATSQYRHVGNRMDRVKNGEGEGLSMSGLNLQVDGQAIPDHVLQSAVEGILGGGASGDSFADFGKLGLFIQGDLDFGERDETELESGYDFDSWALTLGGDYRFTDTLFGGASISFGEAEVDYDANGGSTDISNWSLAVYSGWSITQNLYLDGLLSYGQSDIETARNIGYVDAGGDFDSTHNGDTDGDQLFVGINMGYMLNRGSWRFGPTASLAYLDGSIDGFIERSRGASSQAWNFAVDDQDYESLRLSLGAQADYIWNTSFGVLIPGIRIAYVSEQEDSGNEMSMRLVNNPFAEDELVSDQIVVRTDGMDSSFLDTSFNLSGQFVMGFSGFISYQFYSSFDDYSREGFTLGARWDKPF